MAIAFIYGWRLALILLAVFPIVAAAGAAQLAFISGNSGKSEYASAGRLANEAVGSIRTVAALSAERHVILLHVYHNATFGFIRPSSLS